MLDIAWIGFLLMLVGSLLLLACGWIQIHTQKRVLKTLAEAIFEVAGLAGGGGALVWWTIWARYGLQQMRLQMDPRLAYGIALVIGGVLTIISYKPFIDRVRGWLRAASTREERPENESEEKIERVRKL